MWSWSCWIFVILWPPKMSSYQRTYYTYNMYLLYQPTSLPTIIPTYLPNIWFHRVGNDSTVVATWWRERRAEGKTKFPITQAGRSPNFQSSKEENQISNHPRRKVTRCENILYTLSRHWHWQDWFCTDSQRVREGNPHFLVFCLCTSSPSQPINRVDLRGIKAENPNQPFTRRTN